jgi:hypothetical protein
MRTLQRPEVMSSPGVYFCRLPAGNHQTGSGQDFAGMKKLMRLR